MAVIYGYDCGATTGVSTNISILAPGEKPDEPGDIFIADDDNGKVAFRNRNSDGTLKVRLTWTSDDRIEIAFPPQSRISRKKLKTWSLNFTYSQY